MILGVEFQKMNYFVFSDQRVNDSGKKKSTAF